METSRLGILFIAKAEALVLSAYQDGEHCSIGFGHNDPNLEEGEKITAKQAFALLKSDVKKREPELAKLLKGAMVPQRQWDAMMSLLFNRGAGVARHVTNLVVKGKVKEASEEFENWGVTSKGVSRPGLYARRLKERDIFDSGDYGDLGEVLYWTGNPRTTKAKVYKVQDDDL